MKYKNRLFELRGNLSQKEFAERIGLSQQNYANYENGKQGLKSDLIAKICETFGCSAEWLLELDNVATAPIPGARRAVPAPTVMVPVLGGCTPPLRATPMCSMRRRGRRRYSPPTSSETPRCTCSTTRATA